MRSYDGNLQIEEELSYTHVFMGSDWSLGMSIGRQQQSSVAGGKSPFDINNTYSIPDHWKVGPFV